MAGINPISLAGLGGANPVSELVRQAAQNLKGSGAIPVAELEKLSAGALESGRSGLNLANLNPAHSASGGGGFSSVLGQMVSEVSAKQASAAEAVTGMHNGKQVQLHQAMIAVEEASISFQLMVEVRNKLLESYQELMRMQV